MTNNDLNLTLAGFMEFEPHRPTQIIAKRYVEWAEEKGINPFSPTSETVLTFMDDTGRRQTEGNIGAITHAINSIAEFHADHNGLEFERIRAPKATQKGYGKNEAGSIFLTETEYEIVRDQMTACARDRIMFILSWHMMDALDIAKLKRSEVSVVNDEVRIKDMVIKDRELARAILENNSVDTLYVETKGGILKRRPLVATEYLLWASNIKSTPEKLAYNLPNVPYTMNKIMLRGKQVKKAIPLRNIRLSRAALLYHQHYEQYKNLTWWAEKYGITKDYSIKAREVAQMLYGAA